LLARLDGRDDLRVSAPLRTIQGAWTSRGWTAWRYQPGAHVPSSWHQIVAGGQRLHAALQNEPEPALLATRNDLWAIADRVAWHELPREDQLETKHLDKLIEAWLPVHAPSQLVQGDLSGNVLFHPHLPPLIID
jgi:uncharacterized protein (TIGR02569 family)